MAAPPPPPGCLGTEDGATIWCNSTPSFEAIVNVLGAYCLILFAVAVVGYFCFVSGDWWYVHGCIFFGIAFLLIWAHLKTMLTDPGAVSRDAVACGDDGKVHLKQWGDGFCAKCDRFKPQKAYHCSKCKRCVSRMDHHCPYTNNCVGAKNQKHMILFLLYCNFLATYAVCLVAYYGGYVGYLWEDGWADAVLVAALGCDGLMTLAFTGEMTRRQTISLQTGIGTIDRLKLAKGKPIAGGTPVPLTSIFGHTYILWPLPVNPDFPVEVEEDILGFRTPRAAAAPADSDGRTTDETPLVTPPNADYP